MTPSEPVVVFDEVRYAYGDFVAVEDSSFEVTSGSVFGLLGTNGAGKTTSLELLQGFRSPAAGTVRVFGLDPARSTDAIRRSTGVMLQDSGFFLNVTVADTLRLWADLVERRDDVSDVLERVGLQERSDVPVQALSGGERRRLDVAIATWGAPALIVLDEPTTGLDPASRRLLWRHVRELRDGGSTIVLTTHHLEELEALADTIAIMDRGRIVRSGPLSAVLEAATATVSARVDRRDAEGLSVACPRWCRVRATAPLRGDPDQRWTVELQVGRDRHQDALTWLTAEAASRGAALDMVRAVPGSLEDVFLAIQNEQIRERGPITETTR